MRDDIVFVEHILDCISAIEKFSKSLNKSDLSEDRLKRSAIEAAAFEN